MSALGFMLLVLVTLQTRTAAFGTLITPATNSPRTAVLVCLVGGYTPCCQRPLSSVRPSARSSFERRANTMGANEEMEQLDTIPGMPETVNVFDFSIEKNGDDHKGTSSVDYAQQATAQDVRESGDTGDGKTIPSGINSIFPTGGSLKLTNPERVEYSLDPKLKSFPVGMGPRGHAESIAEEIAQTLAQGTRPSLGAVNSTTSSDFRAAALQQRATQFVETRERRAEATRPSRGPPGIDPTRVPNLWLAVAHSSSVKAGEVKKVEVDGVPIALWRSVTGALSAVSDVCIHRGASLARGWITNDRLVCPYHGFEFETNGRLAHMPGTAGSKAGRSSVPSSSCSARKAPTYPVKELGGWIYIFPDENRPGSVERYRDPMVIPESMSPAFRSVEGSVNIRGNVGTSVENTLDMLHISFVHSFGSMQEPVPFEVSYEEGYDDPGTEALMTSRVTFRYRSSNRSFVKIVGENTEVVVKNEFHLPYRAVIRVFFGNNSLKTIEVTAVPKTDGETTLHWKLYRNFALSHPLDEGPINKIGDFMFRKMMELTLEEDKEIIENIYPEYQQGFMNARFDKQGLRYRKAIADFQAAASDRANSQLESSLQIELLQRIASSQRGLTSDHVDRAAILNLIQRLESVQAGLMVTAAAEQETKVSAEAESMEGEWHLEYASSTSDDVRGWDFATTSESEKMERTAALQEAGGEALLIDWNESGRPLWADTTKSIQVIDIKARTLSNRAVYKGWSGFTTTVQLDAFIEPLKDQANRLMVGFHKAVVDIGGIKVTFPHLQQFSPTGWMETTYMKQGIRIARGNKGSIFVLTRKPMSSHASLFDDDELSSSK